MLHTPVINKKARFCVAGLHKDDLLTRPDNKDTKIAQLQMDATGSEYLHVQIFFEDLFLAEDSNSGSTSVTFTVDKVEATGSGLKRYDLKTFSKDGWDVLTFHHRGDEEEYFEQVQRAYRFCSEKERAGCPYNSTGEQWFKLWPSSGRGKSYFCSEFVMEVLIHAGFLPVGMYIPEETSPGTVMNICRSLLNTVEHCGTLLRTRKKENLPLTYA